MKAARLAVVVAIILASAGWLRAQTSPSLENGWKPFGSYEGSHLDTVNLMNGNLMFHAPIIPDIPGRGTLGIHYSLFGSSKDWQVLCTPVPDGQLWCRWVKGGSGVHILIAPGLSVHRTLSTIPTDDEGDTVTKALGYTIVDANGTSHPVHGVSGTEDGYGEATQFDSVDLSGYHLTMSVADPDFIQAVPVLTHFIVTDRAGNQYQGDFANEAGCGSPGQHTPPPPGARVAWYDDTPGGTQNCSQSAFASVVKDSNGNYVSLKSPPTLNPTVDTLGKNPPFEVPVPNYSTTDSSGCVTSHPFYSAAYLSYIDPNGVTQIVKVCYAEISIQTAFGQANVDEAVWNPTTTNHFYAPVNIILADGDKWTFDYDNYGELAFIGLPTGGSLSYTWETVDFINCNPFDNARLSRAVLTRTLDDGQGHISQWRYNWGTPSSTSVVNKSTDPLGNDTLHTFSELSSLAGLGAHCHFYETSTSYYQGAQSPNNLLQQVDTSFSAASMSVDNAGGLHTDLANVFATDVVTTVYPSGKVKKVHKDPDTGLGAGQPIFGNVKKELEYDWGQGTPGPLLRETDTTYQWEVNSAYLTARLLDLPASAVVKDGAGNRVAETDYSYDEPGYLTTPNPAITTQHDPAPPNGVRGNQTTVSRWLNTTNSFVASHTNWYDTGEVYKSIDPLGHTTTHSYDPFYVGAYATQTCSPTTNGVAHCVSGTYDFNTGLLTSLTNENATTQASGNTPGDSAHTSTYTYDSMFRITSGQAPPDPANSNLRATTSFNFSFPNTFPVSVQRTKSVTAALSDSATSFFDGLGRGYQSQHVLPNGTAKVDTQFDLAGHPATVSNPYFTTSDPTYGNTANTYDGLDRVTQTTKQDGSISRVAYNVITGAHDAVPGANFSGDCTDTTDEAGKQRRACVDGLGRLVMVVEPNPGAAATTATGVVTISGNEQNTGGAAAPSAATITITGNEHSMQDCLNTCHTVWDTGTVAVTVAGYPAESVSYGHGDTLATIAWKLGCAFHNDPNSAADGPCPASAGTSTSVTLTTRASGAATAYSFTTSSATTDQSGDFTVASFFAGPNPGAFSGGHDAGTSDSGNVTISVNGTNYTVSFGAGDTSSTIATRLASAMSGSAAVSASAAGNQVNLTSKTAGSAGNAALSASYSWNTAIFPQPSFTTTAAGVYGGYDAMLLDNSPYKTLYTYDALGNLYCVEQHGDAASGTACPATPPGPTDAPVAPDPNNAWRRRLFAYDSLSRLRWASNPESGVITYTYDNDSELLQKTSPAPNQTGTATQTVSYCYDELHRVTGKGYGAQSCPLATPVVTYAYDSGANAKGHLSSLTDHAGTASYTYDILGRLSAETRTLTGANNAAISKNLSYEYNLDGSLSKLHYPSGAVVTYTPDSAGRTVSAVDSGSGINYVTGATYGPDSALTGFISGSGGAAAITNSFTYNKRLQPLTMSATAPSQTVYSIGYDFHAGNGTPNSGADNGNVYGIINYKDTTHGRDQTFTYDALNRLISAQNAGTNCATMVLQNKTEYWGNSYGYDAWGNLLQKNVTKCGAENLSVTADAHNWLHASGTDYLYDAAGNMTYDATASLNYTFDQENRLTGAAGYTYTYDGDGNRVRKSNGNLAANGTLYWYMTPGVVAESDLAGTLKSEYVFFDGERVARRDGATGTGGVFYYFSDHLKTASVVTDSLGNIKSESDFYPWGGELQFVNNDSNDYKFTGKKRDTETGLDYFGARYYSNGLGRWVSADWSSTPVPVPYAEFGDPQSLNLYGFVGGNPASKADANGHCDSKGFWCKQFKEAASLVVCFMGCQKVTSTSPTAVAAVAVLAKTFQTYTKVKSPGDVYSGRTSGKGTPEENVAARDQGHHKNAEGYGEAKLDKSSTNPDAIRGREQQLIEAGGGAQSKGGTSGNAINGISETNPNGGKYLQAAEHEFGAVNKTGEVPGKLLGAVSIPVEAPPPIVQRVVADFLEAIQK